MVRICGRLWNLRREQERVAELPPRSQIPSRSLSTQENDSLTAHGDPCLVLESA